MVSSGYKIGIDFVLNGRDAFAGIAKMERSFTHLKRVVMSVVAGAVVKEMAAFGKEITTMATQTGMSVSKLQSLKGLFISAGSGARSFATTIDRINRGLYGLNRGEGALAAALAPMGISPFGKDARQVILEAADWAKGQISGGRSEGQVIDYLSRMLGIDPNMAKKMLGGSNKLLAEEARLKAKSGEVTAKNIEHLNKLRQSLDEMSYTWSIASANIVGSLGPVLIPLIDFLSAVGKFAGENPRFSATVIALVAFSTALSSIVKIFSSFGAGIAAIIGFKKFSYGWDLSGGILGFFRMLWTFGRSIIGNIILWARSIGGWSGILRGGLGLLKGLGRFFKIGYLIEIILESFSDAFHMMINDGKTLSWIGKIWNKFWDWILSFIPFLNNGVEKGLESAKKQIAEDESIRALPIEYLDTEAVEAAYEQPVYPQQKNTIINHFEGSTFGGANTPDATANCVNDVCTSVMNGM